MSWFNSIPGLGHIKGLVHDIAGEREEAREAYRAANSCTSGVLNSIPVVGHVKGLVHDVCGDEEGAQKAYQTANSSLNTIPVVGHVKGVVHLIQGEEEKAKEALMAANRSTLVLGGGAVGSLAGPAGAAALAAYTGALTDTVVSAATKKPVGFIKNIETIVEAKEFTDVLVGVGKMSLEIGLDAAAGASFGGAIDSAAQLQTEQIMKSTPNQILKSAPMAPSDFVKSAPKIDFYSIMKEGGDKVIKQSSKQITKEVGKKVVTNQVLMAEFQLLKSTQNQILAKEVEIIGGAICKQAAKNQVVQSVVDNTLEKPKKVVQSVGKKKAKNAKKAKLRYSKRYTSSSSSSSSSDEESENKKCRYIYFFRCLDGTFKVGRTKNIKRRLAEHKRAGLINSDSYITVYECDNAVNAETQIKRHFKKIRLENEDGNPTEFLDSSKVKEKDVLDVIDAIAGGNRTQFKYGY